MEVYRNLGGEDFPRTQDGDLAGMVHPQLQVRGAREAGGHGLGGGEKPDPRRVPSTASPGAGQRLAAVATPPLLFPLEPPHSGLALGATAILNCGQREGGCGHPLRLRRGANTDGALPCNACEQADQCPSPSLLSECS